MPEMPQKASTEKGRKKRARDRRATSPRSMPAGKANFRKVRPAGEYGKQGKNAAQESTELRKKGMLRHYDTKVVFE